MDRVHEIMIAHFLIYKVGSKPAPSFIHVSQKNHIHTIVHRRTGLLLSVLPSLHAPRNFQTSSKAYSLPPPSFLPGSPASSQRGLPPAPRPPGATAQAASARPDRWLAGRCCLLAWLPHAARPPPARKTSTGKLVAQAPTRLVRICGENTCIIPASATQRAGLCLCLWTAAGKLGYGTFPHFFLELCPFQIFLCYGPASLTVQL